MQSLPQLRCCSVAQLLSCCTSVTLLAFKLLHSRPLDVTLAATQPEIDVYSGKIDAEPCENDKTGDSAKFGDSDNSGEFYWILWILWFLILPNPFLLIGNVKNKFELNIILNRLAKLNPGTLFLLEYFSIASWLFYLIEFLKNRILTIFLHVFFVCQKQHVLSYLRKKYFPFKHISFYAIYHMDMVVLLTEILRFKLSYEIFSWMDYQL